MNVVFGLIGVTAVLLVVIVMVMLWAIRSGQFEDMQGPAWRVVMDDDRAIPKDTDNQELRPTCSSSSCDKHAQIDATKNSHSTRSHEQAFKVHR